MTKFLKVSVVAATLLVSSAFGAATGIGLVKGQTSYAVASEYAANNGLTTTGFLVGEKAGVYSPQEIPAISVGNPTVVVEIPGAYLTNTMATPANLSLAEGTYVGGVFTPTKIVAKFQNSFQGKLSLQSSTAISVTNGLHYKLVSSVDPVGTATPAVNTLVAGDLTLNQVPANTTSLNLRFTTMSTDTQEPRDYGQAEIFSTSRQVTATISTPANGIIDAINKSFKLFTTGDTDTIGVDLIAAQKDTSAVSNGDTTQVKIVSASNPFPTNMTAASTAPCTFAPDRMSVVCDATPTQNNNIADTTTITFKADGVKDDILATSFTAEVGYNFANTSADYTIGTNPVATLNAGSWTYNGATLKAPYLASTATSGFARISNESAQVAKVFVTIFDESGQQALNVQLEDIPAHSSKTYLTPDLIAAAKAAGASATLASANDGRFSAVFLVTAPAENVYGSAVVKRIAGGDRVTPMKDNSGFAQ